MHLQIGILVNAEGFACINNVSHRAFLCSDNILYRIDRVKRYAPPGAQAHAGHVVANTFDLQNLRSTRKFCEKTSQNTPMNLLCCERPAIQNPHTDMPICTY